MTRSGHGTFTKGETLRSSVLGTIERVNKLISVHPFRNRFVELCYPHHHRVP